MASGKYLKNEPFLRPKTIGVLAAVVLVAAMVVTGCLTGWFGLLSRDPWGPDLQPDPQAVDGMLDAEGSAAPVQEGNYRIVINQIPTMTADSLQCPLRIQTVEANHYAVRVTIRDDQGETLYRSARIDPGRSLPEAALARTPAPGYHNLTAEYELFDPVSASAAGAVSVSLHLRVMETEES